MKKGEILIILSLCIALATFTGCGGEQRESVEKVDDVSVSSQSESETTISENNEDNGDNDNKNDVSTEESSLTDLEEYLLSVGVLSGERTETAASMIGALSGFKYADSYVEIYEYDVNSEEYKKLSSGESVELDGMAGVSIKATAINGKYVLIASYENSISQDAVDAFTSYK